MCLIDADLNSFFGSWEGEAIGLRRFSLAFSHPGREARFLETRTVKLRNNVFYLDLIAALLSGFSVIAHVVYRPYHLGKEAVFIHNVKEVVLSALCCMFVLSMVVCSTPAIYNKFSPRVFEWLCFWMMLFVMLVLTTFTGGMWTLTSVFGLDPNLVWDRSCFCETSTILWMATATSCMHLQPMRWSILFVQAVGGTAWYVAISLIWGSHAQIGWSSNLLVFMFMVAAISIGKRTSEITERMLFSELQEEKSFRLDAQLGLLSNICDAVVLMDGEGCIQEANPTLASILCMDNHAAGRLVSTRIQTYMQGDDSDRFTNYLVEVQEHPDRREITAPLHVDLRDSLGNKLPVMLRCSCLRNKYGAVRIMMGISETGPREVEALSSLPPLSLALQAAGEGSDSASSSQGSMFNADISDDVWVEFFAATYKIEEASPAYRRLTGAADYGHALFTDALLHVSQFEAWFQDLIQPIRDGVAETEILEETTVKMSLFPPRQASRYECQKRHAKRHTYSVTLMVASYSSQWSPQLKMLARFYKAEHVPGKKRVNRGTSSGASGGKSGSSRPKRVSL